MATLDLDGCYANVRRPVLSPARYARDVAAAFPELGPCGLADQAPAARQHHYLDDLRLPSYKVKSRIKGKRQTKGRRRRG